MHTYSSQIVTLFCGFAVATIARFQTVAVQGTYNHLFCHFSRTRLFSLVQNSLLSQLLLCVLLVVVCLFFFVFLSLSFSFSFESICVLVVAVSPVCWFVHSFVEILRSFISNRRRYSDISICALFLFCSLSYIWKEVILLFPKLKPFFL